MIHDPTLEKRQQRSAEINAEPKTRIELGLIWGEVLDHLELRAKYNQFFFANPVLLCRRKSDGARGTWLYQYSPRFYFRWLPFTPEED